jgi:hypothetical protein
VVGTILSSVVSYSKGFEIVISLIAKAVKGLKL